MEMNYLSIDHMIVYASILITLIVGLRAGKGIKTIREYAVDNKMFGTASLVFAYLATNLSGGSIINSASMIFSDGLIMIIASLGFIFTFIMIGYFIAPHAVYFPNRMTMGDIMHQLYGKFSGIIAGLLGFLSSIFLAGLELVVLGIICKSLIGINPEQAILIGGLILTLYSAHGGIKSVVTTDVLQFAMAAVGIPLIAYVAIHQAVGIAAIWIGLGTTDMFGLFLDSLEATGPILMFPLVTGIMGLKPEKKAFYVAMFVTIVAWIMCKLYLPEDYSYLSTLLCILANGIAFFGTHLYLKKGFKRADRRKLEYLSDYHTAPAFFDRLPQRIYAYVKHNISLRN